MHRLATLFGGLFLGTALMIAVMPEPAEGQIIVNYGYRGYYAPAPVYAAPVVPYYPAGYYYQPAIVQPVYPVTVPVYTPAAYYGYGYVPRYDLDEIEVEYKWRNGFWSVEIDYDD